MGGPVSGAPRRRIRYGVKVVLYSVKVVLYSVKVVIYSVKVVPHDAVFDSSQDKLPGGSVKMAMSRREIFEIGKRALGKARRIDVVTFDSLKDAKHTAPTKQCWPGSNCSGKLYLHRIVDIYN